LRIAGAKVRVAGANNYLPLLQKICFWYAGILIFPALFYVLVQSIYLYAGSSFTMIAYLLAGVVVGSMMLLIYGIKRILPQKEARLEVHFLVCLLVCMVGLLAMVAK
jgi:hypothetical protein